MKRSPKLLPPQLAALALLAMVALHVLLPLSTVVATPLSLVGLVPLAGGGAGVVWARGAFKEASTPLRPLTESTALVTHGLYRYSRNPMYVGAVLVLQHRFIRPEERLIETTFGEQYRAYRARVRRWM
ncbi:MAG: isoprenylcysteine carboxylmethyltransferase family protein [Deltaproteobacteria bacterium]|nr:isoprenylcysteine carboxylmethyltransferase family protein [Deltaproteobacteria bacterium]